jgi:hypothetical protein
MPHRSLEYRKSRFRHTQRNQFNQDNWCYRKLLYMSLPTASHVVVCVVSHVVHAGVVFHLAYN